MLDDITFVLIALFRECLRELAVEPFQFFERITEIPFAALKNDTCFHRFNLDVLARGNFINKSVQRLCIRATCKGYVICISCYS